MVEIDKDLKEKYDGLKKYIRNLKSVLIAYSGGVDSTFLLKASLDAFNDKNKVLAVTARSSTYPEREYKEAVEYINELGGNHKVIISEELDIKEFCTNPVDRCYHCKKELYGRLKKIAVEEGYNAIIDGANADDTSDYRPGMKASKEMEVISPLKNLGFSKNEIRILSKYLNLKSWDKPSFACLASRVPYGTHITKEVLNKIEKSEEYLMKIGFKNIRVRFHNELARIEVAPEERKKFFNEDLMDSVYDELKKIGFTYVALDLKGYRMGSMNETITAK